MYGVLVVEHQLCKLFIVKSGFYWNSVVIYGR